MTVSNEQLLALLADLIRTAPRFEYDERVAPEDERWLGRAAALLEASGAMAALVDFKVQRNNLGGLYFDRTKLMAALQEAYARLELRVPLALRGAFIPPGEAFQGFAALVTIVKSATRDLLLIDPYVDVTLFTEIARVVPEGVQLRCLTSNQFRSELSAASDKWIRTGEHVARPVAVRIARPRALHDRYIIVDGKDVWSFSQSFKDIATRSAASVTQDLTDLAARKIEFWDAAWSDGMPLDAPK